MARVLYLTEGFNVHDRRFLAKLAAGPHEVHFLPCREDAVSLAPADLPVGVQAHAPLCARGTGGSFAAARAALKSRLAGIRPDLVHAGPVPVGGLLAAAVRARPLLVMSWGSDVLVEADRGPRERRLARFVLRRADMALGDCRAVREKLAALSGLPDDRIVTLPWGIEPDRYAIPRDPRLRARLGWPEGSLFLATRGFAPIHAPLTLLAAFDALRARRPRARLLLLGDGPLRADVEAFIRDRGLRGLVHLEGRVPDDRIPGYFAGADVYVSSTLSDGTSISLLEGMASGLPVVAADAFGNREWVEPGVNGWLHAPGDAASLERAMEAALDAEDRRGEIGAGNRARIRRDAAWNANFPRVLEAYERLLGGRP